MNPHLKQLWAAMRLPENFKKSYKFFCRGLDIRVTQVVNANALYAGVFAAALHLSIEVIFVIGNSRSFRPMSYCIARYS